MNKQLSNHDLEKEEWKAQIKNLKDTLAEKEKKNFELLIKSNSFQLQTKKVTEKLSQ